MGPRKEASNHYHLVIETPDGVRDRRDRVYRKSERSGHLTLWVPADGIGQRDGDLQQPAHRETTPGPEPRQGPSPDGHFASRQG